LTQAWRLSRAAALRAPYARTLRPNIAASDLPCPLIQARRLS
jgi:hypothetical protein